MGMGSSSGPTHGNTDNYNGAISVKKSFNRWTEPSALNQQEHDIPSPPGGLKLQPGFTVYSAACYNTSQEELRPDRASTARSGSGSSKETKGDVELGVITTISK
jgi:hypothetical protein